MLALVNSSAGADRRLTAAAFSCSPLPSRLWTGCLSAVRRPAPALDLQMARGGGRKGAGRGGGRGGGAAQGVPADGGGAERGGKGSRQGKSKLNQLLTVKDSAKQTGGGAVSAKMQDFDPKNMERGTVRFLGSFDADPPKIGLPEVFACAVRACTHARAYSIGAHVPRVRAGSVRMHVCMHVCLGARTMHEWRMHVHAMRICVCVSARAHTHRHRQRAREQQYSVFVGPTIHYIYTQRIGSVRGRVCLMRAAKTRATCAVKGVCLGVS